jgi:HEAT repeat protein
MAKLPTYYLPELSNWHAEALDDHWAAVERFISEVGPASALAAAMNWCRCGDAEAWCVGLDVLGVMAQTDAALITPLFEQVQRAVASSDEDVRWSAVVAMRHKSDDRAQAVFLGLLSDPDSDVRFQAVSGLPLPHQQDLADDHPVVEGLLRAMEDPVDAVRDWAIFGLGTQLDLNTQRIRDALALHLHDGAGDAAGEAARALAARGDMRVFPVLVERLAGASVDELFVEAAKELADPRLLPRLLELRAIGWLSDDQSSSPLDEAIEACSRE